MKVFVDSNLPMYVAGREHSNRDPARRFLERVRAGDVGMGKPEIAAEVYDLFVQICQEVFPVTLADTDRARDLVARRTGASVRDLVHASVMLNNGVTRIASFDSGFDSVPGVKRVSLD